MTRGRDTDSEYLGETWDRKEAAACDTWRQGDQQRPQEQLMELSRAVKGEGQGREQEARGQCTRTLVGHSEDCGRPWEGLGRRVT